MSLEKRSYTPKKLEKLAGAAAAVTLTATAFTGFGFKEDNGPQAITTLIPVIPSPIILVDGRINTVTPDIAQVTNEAATRSEVHIGRTWEGTASYYSRAGCVGCSPGMIMANGQPLDDTKPTAAFNRADLGTKLRVTDRKNGNSVVVEVTDRGGFEDLGRIIDLSLAAKNSLDCTDLADVLVEEIIS